MTAATRPIPIDRARRNGGPVRIEVSQNELLKTCMNAQALVRELMSRNAEVIRRLAVMYPADAERQHVLEATHAVHDKAVEALNEWLIAADRYESKVRQT